MSATLHFEGVEGSDFSLLSSQKVMFTVKKEEIKWNKS